LYMFMRNSIAEAKQNWSVIGWMTKIYYLKFLHVSEGALSRWSWLHLQPLALTPTGTRPAWWVMAHFPFV
jgi:hypothetical protein